MTNSDTKIQMVIKFGLLKLIAIAERVTQNDWVHTAVWE